MQKYTKEWLEQICAESFSYAEVVRKAGRKGGGSQETVKKKIQEFNIDISHFTHQLWNKGKSSLIDSRIKTKERYNLNEVFCENSVVTQKTLREYIKRHKIIPYKCSLCGCDGHWQNGEISLEVHHKNGNNKDNRIENLTYLCPNCHALTDTYRGKNINKCIDNMD